MDNALPNEMRRNGRPIDPHFQPTEALYIRLRGKNRPEATAADIRLPIQSANRSKYSEPEWALLPSYEDFSVGAVKVGDVRIGETSQGNVEYNLEVEHLPEEDNYAHSEIQTYKNGMLLRNDEGRKINREVRLRLRQRIAENMAVVLPHP